MCVCVCGGGGGGDGGGGERGGTCVVIYMYSLIFCSIQDSVAWRRRGRGRGRAWERVQDVYVDQVL